MAYINKNVSTMAMPSGMNRMGQFPLDMSSVYYDMESLQAYATSGAIAYVGQIVSLVDETNKKVTVYSIQNTDGLLKEVGTVPTGDGSSIEVDAEGKISLKGVSALVFERELEGGAKEDIQYQALMTKNGLIWVEPSKTTVEGLATLIEALTGRVKAIEDVLPGFKTKQAEYTASGSTVKTLTGITQNANGEITATFEDIAFPEAPDYSDEFDGKKDKQEAYSAEGSTVKTITKVEQNENGEVTVTYSNIAFPEDNDTTYTLSGEGLKVTLTPSEGEASEFTVDAYSKSEIDTKVKALTDEDAAIRAIAEATKGRVDTFLDTEGVADIVDSLHDIKAELDKMAETTELVEALALKADKTEVEAIDERVEVLENKPFDTYATKSEVEAVDAKFTSYTNTESLTTLLAGKQDVIPAETYDAFGSAASAESAAKVHADSVAATAKSEAIDAAATAAAGLYATKTAVSELETALDGRLDALEAINHNLYATKEELQAHEEDAEATYAKSADVNAELAKKVESATISHADSNNAEGVTKNGTALNIVVDAYTRAETEQVIADRIKDIAGEESIPAVKADLQAEITRSTAADATHTANIDAATKAAAAAQAKADANANAISALESAKDTQAAAIKALQEADTAADGRIQALETTVNNEVSGVAANYAAISKNASDIAALVAKDKGHDDDIAALKTSAANNGAAITQLQTDIGNVYTKTESDGKFVAKEEGKSLIATTEIERLATLKNYDDSEVRTLIGTNSTSIENITKKGGLIDAAVAAEAAIARAAEKKNADDIAAINTLLNTVDSEDSITSLKELAIWVEEHGSAASEMAEAISANADAIAAINSAESGILVTAKAYSDANLAVAKEYADSKIAALPIATSELAGLIKYDDKSIKKNEKDQLYVAEVSTDLLVNGTMELHLCAGSASV